ncbi:hypothetical protein [Salinibacterium sp. ZJ454]|uniref:hypothetical protein n=1 Tax=Salinibacterium sp. ZJ454 TaxID=2708339 RepID=UPI001421DE1C|nr:hypothetical protein [Salinibacterium sp. ZJ454]
MSTEVPPPAAEAKPGRDRSLIVILSIIGALVVIALVVVFSRGEPELLDASTPEGVVQRYSAAVIAGDEAEAMTYLTAGSREGCDQFERPVTDDIRVTLVSTTERDESADVRVTIVTSFDSGPFGGSEYEVDEVFDLVKQNGDWLVDTAPWQLTICPNTEVTK